MFEYIGELITFLAVVLAVRGSTWDNRKKGIKKLTLNGLFTIVLAFFGLITSFLVTQKSNRDSEAKALQLSEALKNTKEASERAKTLEMQLNETLQNTEEATQKARELEIELQAYKTVINEIREQSERQPQRVMSQYVQITPFGPWKAPSLIYPGSIVKLYAFRCDLILRYGSHKENIPQPERWPGPSEIVIIGSSGKGMTWSLESASEEFCEGKVFVESTPRNRSIDWSWFEERVKAISEEKPDSLLAK